MLKNVGWMGLSSALRLAGGLLLFALIARRLGAQAFGEFGHAMAMAGMVMLPVNYGFGTYLLREAGRDAAAAEQLLADTLAAKFTILALVMPGFALWAWVVQLDPLLLWLLFGVFALESFAEQLNSALRARGLFQLEARLAVQTSLLHVLGVGAVALLTASVVAVAAAFAASRLMALLLTLRTTVPHARLSMPALRLGLTRTAATLRAGLPYAADTALATVNNTVDVLILQHFGGHKAVGLYQAGMKLLQGANAMAPVLGNVYIPRVAAEHRVQAGQLPQLVDLLGRKLLGSAALVGLVFAWLGADLIRLLFGDAYAGTATLMPWLGLLLLTRHLATLFGVNLTAAGLQKSRVMVNVLALGLMLGAAVLLVPQHGALGLVWSLILASLLVALAYAWTVRRHQLPHGLSTINLGIAVAAALLIGLRCSIPG